MLKQVVKKTMMIGAAAMALTACDKGASYSLLAESDSFQQEAVFVPKKIDVLWVIDNSGSMATSQQNLASNFQSFIARFNQSNYDFHMGVVTTDGWEKDFYTSTSSQQKARLRDGLGSTHSGVFVMDKNTPNLSNVFTTNIKQGVNGNGDERGLESMRLSLLDPFNANFRRADAFLAVIIVSDEEDGSSSTEQFEIKSKYYPISRYTDFLDDLTGGTASGRNYSVNSIIVENDSCKKQLNTDNFDRTVGSRYAAMSEATKGITASLCSNFGSTLQLISDSIIQLSSVFKLNREPVESSIVIKVNGSIVPNDATNGWTYDPATLTITFHGTAVPGANADIRIAYDPVTIKE